jgi:hypothetical protein
VDPIRQSETAGLGAINFFATKIQDRVSIKEHFMYIGNVFKANMLVYILILTLATLGGASKIEMILSLSRRPRCCYRWRYRANFRQWKHWLNARLDFYPSVTFPSRL